MFLGVFRLVNLVVGMLVYVLVFWDILLFVLYCLHVWLALDFEFEWLF